MKTPPRVKAESRRDDLPGRVKRLSRLGKSSLALLIEQPILDLLDISPSTPLRVRTDGRALVISPIRRGRARPEGRAS
jgi:hypothetical protein